MTDLTMAQKVADSDDFDVLWAEVDHVDRLDDGSDLYTYPDGSQLNVSKAGTKVIDLDRPIS
ncbi:hypothetical protein [Pseudomonas fulva]|uniref:hypothetical protein n=1 Tax=Pseudomonas fulva TaxID=47880 RepID=UPI0034CF9513